ncbi:MAG: hypothetical protein ISR52_10365 [Rhodospirillales bacterium]|nr:hypothetical protein [Rhodospirillales bacterium]
MPSELRKILFDPGEVQTAALSYCIRAQVYFPEGSLDGIEVENDPERTVVMKFSPKDPADPREVILSREQVAAALIRFCLEHQIPIPKDAQKVLKLEDTGIAMLINRDWK